MKNIITTVIFAPIAVSIVSVGLLMLSDIVQYDQMTWAIWGITIVSTFCSLLIISGLGSFWLAQWLACQITNRVHVIKKNIKFSSQYNKALSTN